MEYDKMLRSFIKGIADAQSEYTFFYEKVNELDKATSDILHQMELGSPKDRGKWATKLTQIRKERRYAKDKVAITEPIVKYADLNCQHIKAIERVLGEVRKEKNRLQGRTYSPKVIKNLTISMEVNK